ncbi:hypothetical protein GCM10027047_16720 [Rhodococcus aerolatus]
MGQPLGGRELRNMAAAVVAVEVVLALLTVAGGGSAGDVVAAVVTGAVGSGFAVALFCTADAVLRAYRRD